MHRNANRAIRMLPWLFLMVSGTVSAQWNGEIAAWGLNNYGQCNVPAPNQNFIAISGAGTT